MIRRLVTTAVLAFALIPAVSAWADDSTPSPSPTASASEPPSSSETPTPTASPSAEQPTVSSDPREGTWVCSDDGSSCELVRDCQQEAFAQGFDPADYCVTPAAEPTVDASAADDDVDVAEFPYTPEELDALPDDSPLLTDGGWLAVDS